MEQNSQRNKEEEVAYWLSEIHLQPLTPSAPPLPLAQSSPAKSYCGSSGTSSGGRSRHVSFNSAESGYSSPARSLPPRRRQISSNSTASETESRGLSSLVSGEVVSDMLRCVCVQRLTNFLPGT